MVKYILLLVVITSCRAQRSYTPVRMECKNSISPQTDTLWVVDGNIRTQNPFPFITPLVVNKIDTLSGEDAGAIYGSRAANGAFLITTNFRELHKQGWFMGTTCSPTYVTKKKE